MILQWCHLVQRDNWSIICDPELIVMLSMKTRDQQRFLLYFLPVILLISCQNLRQFHQKYGGIRQRYIFCLKLSVMVIRDKHVLIVAMDSEFLQKSTKKSN